MGETPTPQGAEAQMPAAAPAPEETPDVIEVIVQALSEVPKVKGRMWVGGDILLTPDSVTPDGDWTVTVWLENPTDKATISNYLKKELPELYGRVEYRAGEPSAEEPAIPVDEEEIPEEMPPGLMEQPSQEDVESLGGVLRGL
jgi:hypothetical protein